MDKVCGRFGARCAPWLVVCSAVALGGCPPPATSDAGDAQSDATADMAVRPDAPGTDGAMPDMGAAPDARDASADGADAATDGDAADATPDGGDAGCTLRRVIVTTTDFMVGGYAVGNLAGDPMLRVPAPPAGDGGVRPEQDHVVRTSGCIAFDLWRTFAARTNTLVVLDPDNLFVPRRTIPLDPVPGVGDAGMPQAANPYDIAVASPTRAYVTQYNSPDVVVIDPTRSGSDARVGTISLSPFGGADGIPEAASVALVGTRLYVAVQQLDRSMGFPWRLPARSQLVVIDTTMGAYGQVLDMNPATSEVDGIALTGANPQARIAVSADGQRLLVASSGDFTSNTDGTIDVVNTTTNAVERSITAAMLGGDPGSVEVVSGTTAWTSLDRVAPAGGDGGTGGDAGPVTRHVIVAFDFATGAITAAPIAQSTAVNYGGLRRAPDGNVWAIDTGYELSGSVHAFRPDGTPLVTPPFATPGTNTYSLDFAP